MAQEKKKNWYLDSSCSRQKTSDKEAFVTLKLKEGGMVAFGDNDKGHIIGIGEDPRWSVDPKSRGLTTQKSRKPKTLACRSFLKSLIGGLDG